MDAFNQFLFSNGNLNIASNREDASAAAAELVKERGCDDLWLDTWMSYNDRDNPSHYSPHLKSKLSHMLLYQRLDTLVVVEGTRPTHTVGNLQQLSDILSEFPDGDRGRLEHPFRYHPGGASSSATVTFHELHETRAAVATFYRCIQHEMEVVLRAQNVVNELLLTLGRMPTHHVSNSNPKTDATLLVEVAELGDNDKNLDDDIEIVGSRKRKQDINTLSYSSPNGEHNEDAEQIRVAPKKGASKKQRTSKHT